MSRAPGSCNHRLVLVLAVWSACMLASPAGAQRPPAPLSPSAPAAANVPDVLRPWMGWVLHGKEEALCAPLDGSQESDKDGDEDDASAGQCTWPARLVLVVDDHGGHFTQQWRVRGKRTQVPLPGDKVRWPQDVRVDGKPATVVPDGEEPVVQLQPGDHVVSGAFYWDEPPESLQVPSETGLLSLTVRGKRIDLPNRDADGTVWLEKQASHEEADVMEVSVHRLVEDDIPLRLTTAVQLRVSGKSREVVLGRALPEGFVPMSLSSPVPARLEPDHRLRVQVRPGTYTLTLVARHDGPVAELLRPEPAGSWKDGDEVWAFAARPELRVVQVEGVASIDPQQTVLPDEWKRYPTYAVKLGDRVRLVEQRRGDAEPAPDNLSLRRELWLDFDGRGWTAQDTLLGTLSRSWRLEVQSPTQLGRVAVGGVDQFITRGDKGRVGIEVRRGTVDVSADSRLPGGGDLPAVSWDADFHDVQGTLHLPPGWRLLHARGADEVPGTWVERWSLLDLFLVLITAMAVARLYGWRWGVLALVALALALPERDAPRWVWLCVLAAEALVRLLPAGRASTVTRFVRLGLRVGLSVLVVGFAIPHVRGGLFPALSGAQSEYGNLEMNQMDGLADAVQVMARSTAPAPLVEADEAKEDSEMLGSSGLVSEGGAKRKKSAKLRNYVQEYDPNQMVQTGPGLPRWRWSSLPLRWTGPVARTQRLHLYLIGPTANVLLALLRVALLALLVLRLIDSTGSSGVSGARSTFRLPRLPLGGTVGLGVALLLSLGGRAAAELPPKEMLEELRGRLLEPPECRPHCASSPRLLLEATPGTLRMRVEIAAAAPTGVPLPGAPDQWAPEQVLLDGKPAPALLRSEGRLWLEVPEGSHQVVLEGPLPQRDTVQIALPLKPHRVEAKTDGWQLDGVHEDGLADDDLQLTRVRAARGEATAALQPGALPPFVRVERLITLGLVWQVETKVERLTPTGSAVVLEVPLLPGESVTTAEVRVVGGKAQVNMGATATEVSWRSLLKETDSLELFAPRGLPWTEVWMLEASPVWHVQPSGIPTIHQLDASGLRRPEWRPWPGESVKIAVRRPSGVPGQTLTVDRSALVVRPGLRSTDVTLSLSIRASRGGRHELTLPQGAVLESMIINGASQPLRQDRDKVVLQVLPGPQQVKLTWRQGDAVATRFVVPRVDLGTSSVNAELAVELANNRWVLLAGGPRLGPAVLFWSFVLVMALVALGLGQVRWTPLRARHWLLLGLGLSQVGLPAVALVVCWLLVLGWRDRQPGESFSGRIGFNVRQVAIVLLTMAALAILVASIREGLLGQPDMQIEGNGSTAGHLQWYQDRVDGVLPRPWVLSVPLLVYRLAMLLWALWLAAALLRWVRWGFAAFGRGGLWRATAPKGGSGGAGGAQAAPNEAGTPMSASATEAGTEAPAGNGGTTS